MILIAGPPCGGKSTYAGQHAAATDLVLDFDAIAERIAGQRYSRDPGVMAAARAEWHAKLPDADWVIWNAPRRAQRGRFRSQWGASVLVVTASREECLRRAADARPPSWQQLVRQWFAAWEPSQSGREQIITTG